MSKTRTFRLHKLVRDKIITSTEELGGSVEARALTAGETNIALTQKLIEEATELLQANISADEIADLQEIIDQLCENLKISRAELSAIQEKKRNKNGGFKNGDFIETVTLPADNEWAQYYASDPKRFPELKK